MKICQVNPGCGIPIPPPSWGAIEKIIWEFTQNLTQLGHEVDIKYSGYIEPNEYDIVHCHVANLASGLIEKGIPYIYHLHDHHIFHYGKDSQIYKENLRIIENSLITLVPARYLVDYFGSPKCVYFSHGVNTKEFFPIEKPKPKKPKLLMIANNGLAGNSAFDRKGFVYGVGLAMLKNLPITIAGPSDNKKFFNENLWVLNYSKLNLIFDTPNEYLLDLYHKHDIFLHPSMLEAGHPNLTMLEAAAAGLPLIANWEENTNFHGAWRAPRDVFKMAEGLDHIMSNWELYRNSIYETSQNLSWESRTEDLLKIYNSLL